MRTSIIRIGNSFGVRIPMPIIKECGLTGEVEMQVKMHTLQISPVRKARENWDESFKKIARSGDDGLLDADSISMSKWDEEEWEWK